MYFYVNKTFKKKQKITSRTSLKAIWDDFPYYSSF